MFLHAWRYHISVSVTDKENWEKQHTELKLSKFRHFCHIIDLSDNHLISLKYCVYFCQVLNLQSRMKWNKKRKAEQISGQTLKLNILKEKELKRRRSRQRQMETEKERNKKSETLCWRFRHFPHTNRALSRVCFRSPRVTFGSAFSSPL